MANRNLLDRDELEQLRARLQEDAPGEAESLLAVAQQLQRWQAPPPTARDTAQLIARLQLEMLAAAQPSRWQRVREWWPLLLVLAQLRIVRREILAASLLVVMLGVVVNLTTTQVNGLSPLAILAPVMAAVGVALLYDSDMERILDLEDSTPASARLLLLARLLVVFGLNLVFSLVGSVVLALARADVLLWPLILSWLVPMTFLSAFAFWLSVVTGDSIAGMVFSLLVWGLHVTFRLPPMVNPITLLLSLPGLSDPVMQPRLLILAALLVVMALWLVGEPKRRTGESL
ncbi:MAG TPA: hypothetical protein VHO69_15085 [Phototrophicaceae bacterium]|nr:hypothetical protein [Phototrophicaceae bacterium]